VLVAPGPQGFVCASFVAAGGKRAETSGFLPAEALDPVAPAAVSPADWVGRWQRGQDGQIAISAAGERLKLVGEASFGRSGAGRAAAATGEFEVIADVRGPLIAVGQGYSGAAAPAAAGSGCQLRLRLFGRYLAVEDNGLCGGIGVSFTGTYVRLN
jgi:hypothetical protein